MVRICKVRELLGKSVIFSLEPASPGEVAVVFLSWNTYVWTKLLLKTIWPFLVVSLFCKSGYRFASGLKGPDEIEEKNSCKELLVSCYGTLTITGPVFNLLSGLTKWVYSQFPEADGSAMVPLSQMGKQRYKSLERLSQRCLQAVNSVTWSGARLRVWSRCTELL